MIAGSSPRPRFTEDWLVAVLDSLSEGVVALDATGRVKAANPAAERLLRFSLATDRYAHWSELSWAALVDEAGVPLDPHPLYLIVEEGRRTGPQVVGLADDDATRWLSLATHELQGEGVADRGVVVSFQEVTDRVTAEHELQRILGVLRDVLSATTHDLRSPITAIQGYAQILLESWTTESDADREAALNAIVRQTRHLSRLAGDLSVVAGLESGAVEPYPEPLAAVALVRRVVESVEGGEDLVVEVPEDLRMTVDPTHAQRMLGNLVENAVKYGQPPVEVRVRRDDGQVVLSVRDHGPGVPEDFVPAMYDRFTRSPGSRRTPGSGLGLAIVWGLAHRNGGEVTYLPADGGGARFELRLPTSPPGPTPDGPARPLEVRS